MMYDVSSFKNDLSLDHFKSEYFLNLPNELNSLINFCPMIYNLLGPSFLFKNYMDWGGGGSPHPPFILLKCQFYSLLSMILKVMKFHDHGEFNSKANFMTDSQISLLYQVC